MSHHHHDDAPANPYAAHDCEEGGQSRRAFLRHVGQLGLAGVAAPFVSSLAAIGEAAAATATDYKALVCVFLYGGNDYANTLIPYDAAGYGAYQSTRSNVAIARDLLAPTALTPAQGLDGGRQYALNPALAPLLTLFDQGRMAPVLNVGTLVQPTTKQQYQQQSVRLPPKLFSHADQQNYFQASAPDTPLSGWGGRIGDLMQSGNGAATLTCINASGNAVYLTGRNAVPYSIGSGGPVALIGNSQTLYGSSAASKTLRSLMTASSQHLIADEYARVGRRSLDTYAQVTGALAGAPVANFPLFPSGNGLADQLRMVARMIAVSAELGTKRQVFFVSLGGFDLHDNLTAVHPRLLGQVAAALRAFHDTTVNMGVADQVTAFTASDFGRTLVNNNDGSDHGWGSMHFVLGGAVQGRRFYGTPPAIGNGTPDDVGQGRLIPTTSVDQYAATLASWFGVSQGDLRTVLPNIGNYDQSSWNLGFV